ncbi:MAG: hypothetical protein JWM89_1894 [Acidimicrobiales bacterium]|nr:hypothetical protein [Acidimicrobiales bacterium]
MASSERGASSSKVRTHEPWLAKTGVAPWLPVCFLACAVAVLAIGEDASEPHGPLPLDRRAFRFVIGHRTDAEVSVARALSHLGDPVALAVLALVVGVWLWMSRPILDAAVPALALVAASATEAIAKQIIGRPRPPVAYHLVHESDASFPSGHTTGSAALFVAFALVLAPEVRSRVARRGLVVGFAVLAAAVGASRLLLGVHWLTDVVAGWCLGTAWAAGLVLLVAHARARTRAGPGGG